jgi:hypothetical protein
MTHHAEASGEVPDAPNWTICTRKYRHNQPSIQPADSALGSLMFRNVDRAA